MNILRELNKVARDLESADFGDEPMEEEDPNFVAKVRALRGQLNKLNKMKRKKLNALGIGTIRGRHTVEDLVDALMRVLGGGVSSP
jgi:hypothetical protein